MPLNGIRVPYTDEADWLEKRRAGIGASQIAAALGLDPYTSQYSLWAEKTGELPPGDPSEPMLWGRRLEAAILDEWESRNQPLQARERGSMFRHHYETWATCTTDGVAYEGDDPLFPVQVKTGFVGWDEIPDHVALQVNWEQYVTGLIEHPAKVVLLPASRKLLEYDHEYDVDLTVSVLAGIGEFRSWVERRVPPPVDASGSTAHALAQRFLGNVGEEVELEGVEVQLVRDLLAAKESAKLAQERVGLLENRVKEAMGNAEVATFQGRTLATWKRQTRKGYVVEPSEFRRLLVKEKELAHVG